MKLMKFKKLLDKINTVSVKESFNIRQHKKDKATICDIEAASMSSTDFWDNPNDDVWDHV